MTFSHSEVESFIRIISVISCLCSLSVLLSYVVFPDLRQRTFMHIIFFMTLSDFMMNITSIMGFPANGTFLCSLQGAMQLYFAVASWFWTTSLSYSVYSIVINGRFKFNMTVAYIICWGVPLLLALLPLTTSVYGAPAVDYQWCVLLPKPNSPDWAVVFWSYVSFFGWLFLCIALMILWGVLVFRRLVWQKSALTMVVKQTYERVWLYPVMMIVCWSLNYFIIEFSETNTPLTVSLSMIFGICNGILAAIVFFAKNREIRHKWNQYLCNKKDADTTSSAAVGSTTGTRMTSPIEFFDLENENNANERFDDSGREETIVGGNGGEESCAIRESSAVSGESGSSNSDTFFANFLGFVGTGILRKGSNTSSQNSRVSNSVNNPINPINNTTANTSTTTRTANNNSMTNRETKSYELSFSWRKS